MPFGSERVEVGVAIALSGGGFRATLFHVGALWRLNELGVLRKLDRISSVSGGAIAAGVLGLHWPRLEFDEQGVARGFDREVVTPLRTFCERRVDAFAIGEGIVLPWRSVSNAVARQYRRHLFGEATLQDLPNSPRFVINATNLQTGRSFRFSKPYCGDYRLGLMKNPTLRLAQAVAASSAFPPFLSPVKLKLPKGAFEATPGADLNAANEFTSKVLLTDGGAYDNFGLETVWNRYETLLISDGGGPFAAQTKVGSVWHKQAMRAFDIATDQSRGLRKQALVADYVAKDRLGAFWGIDMEMAGFKAANRLFVSGQKTNELASIRTRLNTFSEREQCELINWGYAVSDAAIRTYWLQEAGSQDPAWPYPEFGLA